MGASQRQRDMKASERQREILKALCRRRQETIPRLAAEFGVSERTVRRDIETLSLTEPVYTMPGRYTGGVFVIDDYRIDHCYFDDSQAAVLQKVLSLANGRKACVLSKTELSVLTGILSEYTKPKHEKQERRNL